MKPQIRHFISFLYNAGLVVLLSLACLLTFGCTSAYAANYIYQIRGTASTNIWRIDPQLPGETQVVTGYPGGSAATLAQCPNGQIFYAINATNGGVYRWDPATPATAPALLGTLGTGIAGSFRMACSPTGILYYLVDVGNLYTISQTTGAATATGAVITGLGSGGDMAFNPSGTMYVVNSSLQLFTASTGGGAATSLGSISGIGGATIGLAFNSAGTLYAQGQNPSQLYTVNLGTLAATSVVALSGGTTATGDMGSTTLGSPTVAKSFAPLSIGVSATSVLTVTLTNPNSTALTGASFTDTYPAGLTNTATPSGATTCAGGAVTAAANGTSLALAGGTIPGNGSCTITVNVTSASTGSRVNTIPLRGLTTTTTYNDVAASATLTVLNQPTISKSFAPNPGSVNGTSVLTITLSNSNATAITGATFTDTYPIGLTNAATPAGATTCTGGTVTAANNGTSVALAGGTIPASGSCTVTVNVTSATAGSYANTIPAGGLTTTNAGSNTAAASATYTVLNQMTIAKTFSPNPGSAGGTSVLTITLTNSNAVAVTGTAFTDTYPAGLTNTATPAGATNCTGGTVTAAANGASVALAGATVPANGSCAVTVNVTAASPGSYANTIPAGAVTTTNGGTNGAAANATYTVLNRPAVAKSFSPNPGSINGVSLLTITLSNSNATPITGVAFTDTYPAGLANTVTPAAATSCAGGTAIALSLGTNVSLSGATIPANGSCTVTVNVTAAAAGSYANTIPAGGVTSTNASSNTVAGSATYTVLARPAVIKAFSPNPVGVNDASLLTLTITNPNASTALTGIALSDTYPAGLTNTSTPSPATTCTGATLTGGTALGNSIGITGGTIAADSSCTITVNVTSAIAGGYNNTTGNVSSTNAGTGGNASQTLVVVNKPTTAKSFTPTIIGAGGTSTLSLTISNSSASVLTGVAFTDSFPAGLVVAATPALTNSCNGTINGGAAGNNNIGLSNGSVVAAGSCTITVAVTAAAAGSFANTAGGVSSNESGSAGPASNTATLITLNAITVAKAFSPSSIGTGNSSLLTITLSNSNATAVTGTAFTDAYPVGVTNSAAPAGATTCAGGTVTAASGGGSVSLAGATIPANGACTVTVNVTSASAGNYNNNIPAGSVTTTNGGSNAAAAIANLAVLNRPTIAKAFAPGTLAAGGTSLLTITLANSNSTAITGADFTDNYPSGLTNSAAPGAATTCGGTITANANGSAVALSGGTIPANGSCTVSVNVTASTAGSYVNSVPAGALTTGNAGANTTAANAILTTLNGLTVAKAFGPTPIGVNGTSVLTITLTNGNSTAVTGAAFTDAYPSGLVNTASAAGATTCSGGTVTAANGGASLALAGGSVPANGSCTVTANVTSATAGTYNNSTGTVTTANAGSATAASATLAVFSTPSMSKAFSPTLIGVGGVSTLTFTLTNNNAIALTGVAFSDTYPAGLINAPTPNLTTTCGGTAGGGTPGGSTVSLSGGTIPANGSCTLRVDVTSNTAGTYNNVSGAVSSTNGGTGNTASASLTVLPKPSITKSFSPASISSGGTSTLTLTLANTGAVALTGVAFTDTFPSGLVVSPTPSLTNSCGGAISGAGGGNNFINLANGTLAANGSCSITVQVTASTVGTYDNNTSGVSANETGSAGNASNVARLTVVGAPAITKAFSPTVIIVNGTSTLTFTLTNNNSVALTGVAFTDIYPTNLVNAVAPSLSNTCGGAVSGGTSGGSSIGISGVTLAANSSCTLSVKVTSGTGGTYNNVSGAVTSTNGGTGNTASATLAVVTGNPAITKTFSPTIIRAGQTSTITFTLSNSTPVLAATNASFTDNLPAGMVVAAPPATNLCGGTLSASAGSSSISLSGGTIPPAAVNPGTCSITVNITAATAGTYNNTAGAVTSSNGTGNPSNTATLIATGPATIVKSFNPSTILANGTSTMSFVITNSNPIPLTGLSFADNFPSGGLQVAPAPNVTNNCGGTLNNATPDSTSLSLSGGTLAAGASCTLTVVVTSPIPGTFSNTTTGVSTNEASTGAGANAVLLTAVAPDLRITKTHSGSFTVGTQGTYTLTVDNALGTSATVGTITVADTLPAGLGFVSASGTGWACAAAGQVVSCTSTTAVAAGAIGNPITLNVSVAATAVPRVTNSASVSGGGEPAANNGNNGAFDPTVVVVAAQNAFQPDGAQTALPGTAVFYPHSFNAGIAGTVSFSTTNAASPAVSGWNNVAYRDSNCNGVLDGTEGNAPLTGNISVNPGDTVCIVVKEFVPAGAPYNARDVITVTATFTPAAGPVVTYTHTDTTTVGNAAGAGLTLQKTVRNVTTGGAAGTSNAARPGETLEYTIAYTNNSADPLATIVVNDSTPAFTTYVSASCGAPLPANITACNVTTQPSVGGTGAISWTLTGSLVSTQSGTVIFRVLLQ